MFKVTTVVAARGECGGGATWSLHASFLPACPDCLADLLAAQSTKRPERNLVGGSRPSFVQRICTSIRFGNGLAKVWWSGGAGPFHLKMVEGTLGYVYYIVYIPSDLRWLIPRQERG